MTNTTSLTDNKILGNTTPKLPSQFLNPNTVAIRSAMYLAQKLMVDSSSS